MKKIILTLSTFALTSSLLAHDNCPVSLGEDTYLEKVTNLTKGANSCWEASEIVSACSLGSNVDVYLVENAIEKCEKDMLKMSPADKKTYAYLNSRCDEKYGSMIGSMYRSANAFCRLEVTKFYNRILSPE